MTKPLLVAIDGQIATLTLNRPESGNALDMALAKALFDAALQCDLDETIRCVVLTGTGRMFCAGGDIHAFAHSQGSAPAFINELVGICHMAVTRLMRMAKPLLVVVNGPAAGAGLSLALAGDIVLAAKSAHFTAAYTGIGLSPDVGMSWLLPRVVGLRKAQEMILTNRRLTADEAEAAGLITRAVDDGILAAERDACALNLSRAPTRSIGAAKSLLIESYNAPLEQQLEREARTITASSRTEEFQEGLRAFLERRRPDFASK